MNPNPCIKCGKSYPEVNFDRNGKSFKRTCSACRYQAAVARTLERGKDESMWPTCNCCGAKKPTELFPVFGGRVSKICKACKNEGQKAYKARIKAEESAKVRRPIDFPWVYNNLYESNYACTHSL